MLGLFYNKQTPFKALGKEQLTAATTFRFVLADRIHNCITYLAEGTACMQAIANTPYGAGHDHGSFGNCSSISSVAVPVGDSWLVYISHTANIAGHF